VLERVCDLVAPTVAALGLAASLQQSRAALVSAREEERMRLRRDLHDGMGAALAGLRLQVESAGDLVPDPTARQLLVSAASGVAAAIDDLRVITDDLRPPALDDLGLATCLVVLAERLSTPSTRVMVDVDVPGDLPAAVEVACYRIAAEAMANAVRHAGARRVRLELHEAAPGLALSVSDDGRGLPERIRPGALGLSSMRARAEELGGSLTLTTGEGGTTVLARIPVEAS
jgi:signal transduction histidine kinase